MKSEQDASGEANLKFTAILSGGPMNGRQVEKTRYADGGYPLEIGVLDPGGRRMHYYKMVPEREAGGPGYYEYAE